MRERHVCIRSYSLGAKAARCPTVQEKLVSQAISDSTLRRLGRLVSLIRVQSDAIWRAPTNGAGTSLKLFGLLLRDDNIHHGRSPARYLQQSRLGSRPCEILASSQYKDVSLLTSCTIDFCKPTHHQPTHSETDRISDSNRCTRTQMDIHESPEMLHRYCPTGNFAPACEEHLRRCRHCHSCGRGHDCHGCVRTSGIWTSPPSISSSRQPDLRWIF